MIAVSSSGKSFRALASYLVRGRTGEEQGRVAWTVSRNLPTSDPELAATFMRATAGRSDRVEKPVYHIALSFDPGDRVERATMEQVASKVLERLGLADHQAVIVAHRDRGHAHVHILVNRVHPETGKAWERWQDQPLIQQVLRDEERTLGLRQVAPSLSPREPQSREPTSRVVHLAQMVKAYEQLVQFIRERRDLEIALVAARARSAEAVRVEERARTTEAAFGRALANVYRDPVEARQAFANLVESKGLAEATERLRQHPEALGQLITAEYRRALGLIRIQDDGQARGLAHTAAVKGREAIETDLAQRRLQPDQARTRAEIERVTGRMASLNGEIGRLPKRHELEHQVERLTARLLPREIQRLRLYLTAPQFALVQRLRTLVRDVVLGREDEAG